MPDVPPPRTATNSVRVRAHAKINWFLHITSRRADGYHELDSLVVPISLFDTLSVKVHRPAAGPRILLHAVPQPCAPDQNLATRAARLFLQKTGLHLAVRIRVSKRIPWGSGLGGASSDAAAVLLALDLLARTGLPRPVLAEWGAQLGADVPFFVHGRPARIRGLGEIVTPTPMSRHLTLVVALPQGRLETGMVYRRYDEMPRSRALTREAPLGKERSAGDGPEVPLPAPHNDLRAAAEELCPDIGALSGLLARSGASPVGMSGSGSAVFGVSRSLSHARSIARRLRLAGYWARAVTTMPSTHAFVSGGDGRSPSW